MDQEVASILRSCRIRYGTEKELQDGIEQVFHARGVDHRREEPLGRAGTIDFLVLGRVGETPLHRPIGVEVKIKGSPAAVARQLHRYAESPAIGSLILATTVLRHVRGIAIGDELAGKPFLLVHLSGSVL